MRNFCLGGRIIVLKIIFIRRCGKKFGESEKKRGKCTNRNEEDLQGHRQRRKKKLLKKRRRNFAKIKAISVKADRKVKSVCKDKKEKLSV